MLSTALAGSLAPHTAAAQPPSGTAPLTWAGPYVGVTAGASIQRDPKVEIPTAPDPGYDAQFVDGVLRFPSTPATFLPTPFPTDFNFDDANFSFGGIAGYNVQRGPFVLGIETSLSWLGQRQGGRASVTDSATIPGPIAASRTTDAHVYGGVDGLFTIGPRVGFAATDRLLLFGTGGLAIGHATIGSDASITDSYIDANKSTYAGQNSDMRTGFAVGGGAEYRLSDRVSARLDGMYYDLGSISATINGTGTNQIGLSPTALTVQPYRASVDLTGETVRLGMTIGF